MLRTAADYVYTIRNAGITIHDAIQIGDPDLWIPDEFLEDLLNSNLVGLDVSPYAIRTRSKVVKQAICAILGYPIEQTFPKYKPRFTGQNFDTYNQQSNNLQIWNEEVSPQRRYVIIGINNAGFIYKVRVINGSELAELDTTGTITSKYQARFTPSIHINELISASDTNVLAPHLSQSSFVPSGNSPIGYPANGELLPIAELSRRLGGLIGKSFLDPGITQERNRGAELHKLACAALGYQSYADDGKFPDIKHQLLEIKLQTSQTIDLGLVCPNSTAGTGFSVAQTIIRHCDTRYAVFYGTTDGVNVTLTKLVVTTGEHFFSRFLQFQGNLINKKIQIHLPSNFYD